MAEGTSSPDLSLGPGTLAQTSPEANSPGARITRPHTIGSNPQRIPHPVGSGPSTAVKLFDRASSWRMRSYSIQIGLAA